jgi:molybdopterin molybdotransferase
MSAELSRQPSCQDGRDASLSFDEALAKVASAVTPVSGVEMLALRSALGRVLQRPVTAPVDVPPHRNSAMDGYAVAANDLPQVGAREFKVVGTAWAGTPYRGDLEPGQCVRIMTGAKLPDAADTVVIQEQVEAIGERRVRIGDGHRHGQNVRHPGEDITLGQEILGPGRRLSPADLGLLASLGIAEVPVRRRPRVAFFTSGDELRSIGEPLGEGQIYDSNRYTLYGMLTESGADALDMGVVPDREKDLATALGEAASNADLVLTTGGISVGAADYLRSLIGTKGTILFSKVAIKPGRPVTFGRWCDAWFFGLPGNPVAAMVTFYFFVGAALRRLQGVAPQPGLRFSALAEEEMRKNAGRTEIQRGVLDLGKTGALRVRTTGRQGSGVLTSMSQANCFILLEHGRGSVAKGESVTVVPFQAMRD